MFKRKPKDSTIEVESLNVNEILAGAEDFRFNADQVRLVVRKGSKIFMFFEIPVIGFNLTGEYGEDWARHIFSNDEEEA